ncbi:hypothetical protein SPRG_03088 [Saprolegnia parasitica CBS 223.65]|uniref:Uncharacterized protein n=1 Tax=Saprolegnia parasitica (strain CBS 223.65) TaxID=695850 RepID=A0A067CPI7_SAPPC|nr:hypothetical protein SPRG_03088 [Saprolegnia parasitica CBS 223.65]KDO32614.1 hypothetical protein SPRG_03088 [Saprolegnia parasitica CBS 223.65]|eukprot:XP_012197056.1 hypothetical protein SPRG_03088 [Saprolegnia parasitica CBS 223.65]
MGSSEHRRLLGPAPLSDRCPADVSGPWSSVFFSWLTPLLNLGNARPLEFDDLFLLNPADRATTAASVFHAQWALERAQSSSPKLWRAFSRGYSRPVIVAAVLKVLHLAFQFIGPILIKHLVAYLGDPSGPLRIGLYYTLAVFASGILQSLALRQYYYVCYEVGLRLRSAVVMAVYDKALVLASTASTGEVATLISVDATRLQEIVNSAHSLWYTPLQIAVTSVLMYNELGVAFLGGVGVLCVLVPMTSAMTSYMRTCQGPLMAVKDSRLKAILEVLTGIKVLKLQAWETSFVARILNYRESELAQLRRYVTAKAYGYTIFNAVPSVVTIAAFGLYVYLGHSLDLGTALTSIALFENVRYPLINFPAAITALLEAQVSFDRLEAFLHRAEYVPVTPGPLTSPGILLESAAFTYEEEATDDAVVLRNISLQLPQSSLVAVVGRVGAGKSSLIQAVLGNVKCIRGSVHLNGSVAYVSQQPFIQNATLRDNITFGLPFEHAKYQNAIRVSSLAADLKILPGGDLTEIGEKGINLSGGQRTRVAIARAVYQDADIYLLDDPLAAVDSHVGSDIFKQCIQTALKGKLVVLVTNGLQFLKDCDAVVVLADGKVAEHGTFADLVAIENGVLATLMQSVQQAPAEEVYDVATTPEAEVVEDVDGAVAVDMEKRRRTSSARSDIENDRGAEGNLIVDEDRATGDVPWATYKVWIRACGGFGVAFWVVFFYILSQVVNIGSTFWLSYWSEQAGSSQSDQLYYFWIFTAMNAGYTLTLYVRIMALYLAAPRPSAARAHVVFDTTPLGRIVNRLSKDVYAIDESIPANWGMLFGTLFSVISTLATIVYVTPYFSVVLLPLGYMYYRSQRFFVKTSRELQRLDSISRSPIYALLTETLEGIATIRAFGAETQFAARNEELLDRNQRAYFLNFSANCWLALRLEFAGTVVATAAALFAVFGHEADNSVAFAGLAGVSLSYAFSVTQSLNWSVRMLSTIQTQMVSVERVHNYCIMDTEAELYAPQQVQAQLQAQGWPSRGQVTFENVDLRYRPGLPRVLRGLTFSIHAKEKVGIVGRTGAGKSSLVVALMRIVEPSRGRILLDGVDVATIGLHDLRDQISIIPQDPVLFSGSVRSNLDPFSRYDDAALWTAIKRAHLDSAVTSLDDKVDERGMNFSVGERQLICIARALLKKSKVILMDEATASIDANTDRLIQQSIRDEFVDCTTLTIAHRINTILDCDRILVMDKGGAAEFDTPSELLKNPKGLFTNLVDHWRDGDE